MNNHGRIATRAGDEEVEMFDDKSRRLSGLLNSLLCKYATPSIANLIGFAFIHLGAVVNAEFPRVPPTPPDKAEATFEVQHGFRMELIAAEPLVASPVDMAYDEHGRAFVVEMRDYPLPEEKDAAPTEFPGTVRLLEDSNEDGRFDQATIFADQLAWPTSVCCYNGGVFVAAAPDIWFFKDTDGDKKADVRRKVFTGFSRYNVQAIMNSLRWGLDNKIYGAAAGNGGTVRHAERPDDPVIQLARRDFRFDPVTEKIEAIAGGQRYGACFDDWGNRFLCNIRNPVQHVVLPLHYVQRNPNLIVPSLIHDCAESGDQLRVFRISPPEPWREFRAQRWALEGANMPRSELIGAGYWTSSSGVCVYRGGAYPEPFRGNVFIGEVAGNLIHRQILERDGVTFNSRRADENTEFVRSRDNWFRPVNFINAPDGTLTVLDMYRETIEHPWSIPDDIKAQLDLSSGKERGRLYRLAPPAYKHTKAPKLSQASITQLVAHLRSPNSWVRETAQRLLFQQTDKSAIPLLKAVLADETADAVAKVHALNFLSNHDALQYADLQPLIWSGEAPELRKHAIVLAEKVAADDEEFVRDLLQLTYATSSAMSLRFQAALTAGSLHDSSTTRQILSHLTRFHADDPWLRYAVLSASRNVAIGVASTFAWDDRDREFVPPDRTTGRCEVIRQLFATHVAYDQAAISKSIRRMFAASGTHWQASDDYSFAALQGLVEGLARQKRTLASVMAGQPFENAVKELLARAGRTAQDRKRPLSERITALELAAFADAATTRNWIFDLLSPTEDQRLQRTALRAIGLLQEPSMAAKLLSHWKQLAPPLREESVNVLLSRPIWHESLIRALETGEVPISQVSIPQRSRLAAIKDEKLAERTKKILASFVLGPRKDVIDRYQDSLKLTGDGSRGQLVYRRECMNCHRLRREGHDVGPSLETVQHRSPQEILIHVLDPNREVSPNFLEYVVRMTDGRVVTGLISADSDAGLTLRRAQNQEETLPRSEIEEMATSGKSLMPEGVEQKVSPQEMADLIQYLRSNG